MNFLDFLIRIRQKESEDKKRIHNYISNRLACFLMLNSKGQRFYTGTKEKYLKEEVVVPRFSYESGEIEDKIIDIELIQHFHTELKKAFENPEESYRDRMKKAKENYLEYRKEFELRKLFSS